MNKNLSPLAERLQQIILESDDSLQDLLKIIDPVLLRELNEAYPGFLSYEIKRQFGLLRTYDAELENELYLSDIKELEYRLNTLSKEVRYKQLKRLREENKNPEFEFIYGSSPVESDDVVSYMQSMGAEEIYERRKKFRINLKMQLEMFFENKA